MKAVVLDNGADTCKIGFAGEASPTRVVSNFGVRPKKERRLFLADQIDQIIDFSSLYYRRPIEKGYVTNWKLQEQIWSRLFGKSILHINTKETPLLVTEPLFNLPSLQKTMDELVFEKYNFPLYHRAPGPKLAIQGFQQANPDFGTTCGVIVESGHSFTHVVPFFRGTPLNYATKRLDVGGKLLTNYLKEIISYRAWNMMDETHLMCDIKHKLCFVSTDFDADLAHMQRKRRRRRPSASMREYVLPNGSTRFTGYVKGQEPPGVKISGDEQCLRMENERIAVPEILFHPSDIGIDQAGIPEVIVQAVEATHPGLHGLLYSNILLTGGNTLFPNFKKRLDVDLRQRVSAEYVVNVHQAPDPILATWHGGSAFASSQDFPRHCVTREEYLEMGQDICTRKFYY